MRNQGLMVAVVDREPHPLLAVGSPVLVPSVGSDAGPLRCIGVEPPAPCPGWSMAISNLGPPSPEEVVIAVVAVSTKRRRCTNSDATASSSSRSSTRRACSPLLVFSLVVDHHRGRLRLLRLPRGQPATGGSRPCPPAAAPCRRCSFFTYSEIASRREGTALIGFIELPADGVHRLRSGMHGVSGPIRKLAHPRARVCSTFCPSAPHVGPVSRHAALPDCRAGCAAHPPVEGSRSGMEPHTLWQ